MDRMVTRKLQVSEESGKIYNKAQEFYLKTQNEIIFVLAKEYLENSKISPKETVIAFLKTKGARGLDVENQKAIDEIQMIETKTDYRFPYSIKFDGIDTGCTLIIDKIKTDESPKPANTETAKTPEDSILNARNKR